MAVAVGSGVGVGVCVAVGSGVNVVVLVAVNDGANVAVWRGVGDARGARDTGSGGALPHATRGSRRQRNNHLGKEEPYFSSSCSGREAASMSTMGCPSTYSRVR